MNGALTDLVATPHRVFQWWLRELVDLTPAWLRRRLAVSDDHLVLYVSSSESVLLRETTDGLTSLGLVNLSDESDSNGSLESLLRRSGHGDQRHDICIRVDSKKAARRQIELPLAAEENLREVIAFELDRFTPFPSERVYFSSEIKGRDKSNQKLKADIVIVPRDVVDPALAAARAAGFEPTRIDVSDSPRSYAAASGNLLPPRPGPRAGSKTLHLAIIAVILATIAVYVPIERLQSTRDALAQRFSAAKTSATAAVSLQKEIDGLNEQQTFLLDLKRTRPMASTLLFEVTRILPDDVYLTAWSLAGSEIQIEGTAQSASAVVGLLEQSHVFRDTTFRSPVTQVTGSARERFRISTKVVGGDPQ